MKISAHFYSEEFISKDMHDDLVSRGIDPRWFINKNIVGFCEWLREQYKDDPIIVNNWKWNGKYNESGLRSSSTNTGAKYSQHKYKDAIDIKIKGVEPKDIRKLILDNFKFLNTTFGLSTIEKVENTPTWIHVDFRWTGLDHLLEVNG